jgi:hypothetical protein
VPVTLRSTFDGTSGFQLIHAIEDKADKATRIVVNTTGLRKVLPFGCGIFHSRLGLPRHRRDTLTFIGRHADRLAPEGALPIDD